MTAMDLSTLAAAVQAATVAGKQLTITLDDSSTATGTPQFVNGGLGTLVLWAPPPSTANVVVPTTRVVSATQSVSGATAIPVVDPMATWSDYRRHRSLDPSEQIVAMATNRSAAG